jgi:ParB-like chromosome segregation protein Spo0J
MEITSLAASLREDGPGLRPLDAEHVAVLEQSMRDYGYRPEFPVLVDRHGRILDGRHRIAAARRAGIAEPLPQREVTVTSDAEAVGLAILMNLQRGWTKAERNRIDSDLRAAGLTVENFGRQLGTSAKREVIRAALLEFPTLTHRAIAKRLELDHKQADRVCAELVDNGTLSHCEHRLTEEGKQAPGQKPKAPTAAETRVEELLLENPQRSNAQIRAAAGLSANQHRIVERARDRLETAAAIPVITAREGRDGTIRRLPHDGTPSPSATASHADAEGSWTTIMERLGRLSDLWRNGPPQATSELTELEALHREIGERIAVLRG